MTIKGNNQVSRELLHDNYILHTNLGGVRCIFLGGGVPLGL